MRSLPIVGAHTAALLFVTIAALPASAQSTRPDVEFATRTDTSQQLRHVPVIPPMPPVLGEIFERPRKLLPNREGSAGPSGPDPVLQPAGGGAATPTSAGDFEGVGNVNSVLPPDPSGAIGPNHYVQVVNLALAVYDRSGTRLYGPVNTNTLWAGFGGPCQSRNDGDPIVLYDHLADRFLVSQFALPNFPKGPFYECIAISQTSDPLGGWYRYEFAISQTKLNDYPKLGVWQDGYYMSVNQFTCGVVRCSWAGAGAVVFERDAMLAGLPARRVYFDLYGVDPNLGGMLPSDLDGPAPPAGAPNVFAQVDDNAWGYSPDQLQLWAFRVNWANPPASTFSRTDTLATAAFDANLCGYARNCIPQGSTNYKVDAISDRLMFRLQYRNFGSHQTLVVNHTVDVNGADRAGIRWYELRNAGAGWDIYQQATFAPDSLHRWMGSAAMNGQGDIAVGYSLTGSGLLPSIAATGRLAGDTLNAMTQGEVRLATGGGYQTHSSGRWGDYSHLSVDPIDDCTFWYTQEYYAGGASSANWRTRIASFKLTECGAVSVTHDAAVTGVGAPASTQVNSTQNVTVDVSNLGNQSESVTLTLGDSSSATISASQTFTLAAGASTTRTFSWTPTAIGTHVLTAAAAIAADGDTQNNSMSATVTVDPASQGGAPTIASVAPNSAQRGTTTPGVVVTGTNFAAGATVTFAGGTGPAPVASNVVRVDAEHISLTVTVPGGGPARARVWNLVVTNPGGQSASVPFTVTP